MTTRTWMLLTLSVLLGCPSAGDGVDLGGLEPDADEDGDGVSNLDELQGWEILIDFSGFGLALPDFLTRRTATSDPYLADTDGDGLSDGAEFEVRSDPRAQDTDGDGLADAVEVQRWRTSPVSVDTDGDSRGGDPANPRPPNSNLFDMAELALLDGDPAPWATSPRLADTDGDGVTDADELLSVVRSPSLADMPQVEIELVDPVFVALKVAYTSDTNTEVSYGSSHEQTSSSSQTRSDGWSQGFSTSNATTITADLKIGATAKGGLALGVEGEVANTTTLGYHGSTTTSSTKETSSSSTDAWSQHESTAQTDSVHTMGGTVSLGLAIHNPGDIAYQISDLGVVIRQWLPEEGRIRTLEVLQPPAGFDSFVLGPGDSTGSVIPFFEDDLDADTAISVLSNPGALILEPAGFELSNGDGENFVFFTENTFSRTALVVIDDGTGEVRRLRIATNIDRTAEGELAGAPLGPALTEAGVDWETAFNEEAGKEKLIRVGDQALTLFPADEAAPELGDPPYPEDSEPGDRIAQGFWAVFVSRAGGTFDLSGDFGDWRLQARDEVRLVYLTDNDRDGVFDREEGMTGARDDLIHSDGIPLDETGDDLSDFFEIRVGWMVGLADVEPYQVFSNPLLIDTDLDGWDDRQEYEAGTDPTTRDTDRDGVDDPADWDPLDAAVTVEPGEG